MRQLYIKSFLFTLVICLTALILDSLVTKGLKISKKADLGVWNAIYAGKIDADIVVNGSSRAVYHVNPKVLSGQLNQRCYNFGMDGQAFEIEYCRFKIYLEHNPPPRVVIQSLDCHTLCKTNEPHNYQQFLPYLTDSTLQSTLITMRGFNKSDYQIPMARYSGEFLLIVRAFKNLFNIGDNTSDRFNGFEAHDRQWNNDLEEAKKLYPNKLSYHLDTGVTQLFEEYIRLCKKNNIKLILVYSPEYIEGQKLIKNRAEILKYYQQLATTHKIPFLNYSESVICENKKLFYNSLHLNTQGADKFSSMLSADIQRLYKDSVDIDNCYYSSN